MNTRKLCLGMVLLPLLATCSCVIDDGHQVATGEARTESQTVALGGAKSVRVALKMGAGELKVGGGAAQLMDADFTYNVPNWKPEVNYHVSGDVGNLSVEQPQSGHTFGNTRYEWDLRLNNKVPMEMTVNMGAGKATMTLGGLALTRLEVNMGAGETSLDLTGDWKNDFSAQVKGGVGKATIRLPRDVGVHVVAHGGLGSINANGFRKEGDAYVNDAYGKSPVTLRIKVEGGVGEIDLQVGEAPPVV